MDAPADSFSEAVKGPVSASSGATIRLWRLCNFVMAVFFGLAGAVQVNDPDPGLWIVAYAVPAVLTLVVSLNPPIADNIVWRSLSDLHLAACVVGSAILGYSLLANAQKNILHEEEGRELFGLVIITVWMSLCRGSAKKNPWWSSSSCCNFSLTFSLYNVAIHLCKFRDAGILAISL